MWPRSCTPAPCISTPPDVAFLFQYFLTDFPKMNSDQYLNTANGRSFNPILRSCKLLLYTWASTCILKTFLISYIWMCWCNRTWKVTVKSEIGELKWHCTVHQGYVVYAFSLYRLLWWSLSEFSLSVTVNNTMSYQGSGHVHHHPVFVKASAAPKSDTQTWSWFGSCDKEKVLLNQRSLAGFICLSYCFRNQTLLKQISSFIYQLENMFAWLGFFSLWLQWQASWKAN